MLTVSVPFHDLAQQIKVQEGELAKLRQELESRQKQLTELTFRKEELQAELTMVDNAIAAIGHGSSRPVESPRSSKASPAKTDDSKITLKPANGVSLPAYLVELLRQAQGPITVKNLIEAVVRNQFPTTSKNIGDIVKTRISDLLKKGVLRRLDDSSLVLAEAVTATKAIVGKGAAGMASNAKKVTTAKSAVPPVATAQWRSLHEVLTYVLANSSKPLTAHELAELVIKNGYESKSKDFKNVIWSSLGKLPNVERVQGEGFRLKKGKASKRS